MANYNLTTAQAVFKTRYLRLSRDMYNSTNIVLAKIKRNDAFTGEELVTSVPTSFGGGRGTGVYPRANATNYVRMRVNSRKLYGLVEIDNEAIKASQDNEGAFVRMTNEPVKRGVQAFQANMSRMLFNDHLADSGAGNGRLGTFSGNQTVVSPNVYDVVMQATGNTPWKQANFEPRDYVNVNTDSSLFEITNVVPATRTVRLTQIDGATFNLGAIGAGTHSVYMQNSRGNDASGVRGSLLATGGNLYGVPVGYRWQASYQALNTGFGISPDILNEGMLQVKYAFGESPDMLVTSFVQYRKLLNQLEDQKRYMVVESRNEGPKGKFSFSALEFVSDEGPVPVVAERFVEDDTLYFLNSDFIEFHARPDGGWVEDPTRNGSIFYISPQDDTWQARYAVYGDFGIAPTAHGIATGLTTT